MALAALIVALVALGSAVFACHLLGKFATAMRDLAQELVEWAEQADEAIKRAKRK